MSQLTIDFNTSGIIPNSSFVSTLVHDRITQIKTSAIQYSANWPEVPVNIVINIINNTSFTVSNYLYIDTVYSKDLVAPAKLGYSTGVKLELNCYMNMPSNLLIKDIGKNLKTILVAYFINNPTFQVIPNANDNLPDWVKFDPSLNMYLIKTDFVLVTERDYTNTPTCYFKTSSSGQSSSVLYKYANKANIDVCSHELVDTEATKQGKVAQCQFHSYDSVLVCPFYKEDKFHLITTELSIKHDPENITRKIDCYMIREIVKESYSLIFEETDLVNNKKSLLKKFSYGDILVNQFDQREQIIVEASKQNAFIIADYTSDYNCRTTTHIQSVEDIKQKKETTTKVSFLSKLISRF